MILLYLFAAIGVVCSLSFAALLVWLGVVEWTRDRR